MHKYQKILIEAFDFYSRNPFESLEDKTLVFFDTETTGFSPHYRQVTEIAAIAVDGETFTEIDTFREFIKLSNKTLRQIKWQNENPPDPNDKKAVRKRGKSIDELLQMTGYEESEAKRYEGKVLVDFIKFVEAQSNPVLVAHNARFDMKMVMTKLKKYYNYDVPRLRVLDTLKFSQLFLVPALQSLEAKGDEKSKEILEMLRGYSKRKNFISSSLGNLNQLIKDRLQNINWHSGLSDVQVTIELFKFIKDYYEENKEETESPVFMKAYAKAKRQKF